MYYYTSFFSTYSTGAFGGKKVSALSEQTGTAASYSAGTLISHPRHQPSACTSCSSKRHRMHIVSPKLFLSFHFHRFGSEHLLFRKSEESFRRVLVMAICSVGGERVSMAPPDRSASRALYHRALVLVWSGAHPSSTASSAASGNLTYPFPHTRYFPPGPGPGARKVACAAHRLAPEPLLHCTGNGRERFSRGP
jgi:hypothetical protein